MADKTDAFINVEDYPESQLVVSDEHVCVPITYKETWNDGFGARGWKLDVTMNDPEIIASTRQTGQKIKTSVFVHDILDHLLSGFGISGHRSEAMALKQLSLRTGSDPRPDYLQMVNEDILRGNVNGEDMLSFLPDDLTAMLPPDREWSDGEMVAFLEQKLGKQALSDLLVERFFELGEQGKQHALASWRHLGLDPERRTEIGLALQQLLETIDETAEHNNLDELKGFFKISSEKCVFELTSDHSGRMQKCYEVMVAQK